MKGRYLELARQVVDLNPSGGITPSIAERQTNVVAAGFGRLRERGGFMYLADEVGLGKTYIALGIAAMLRRFSPHPEKHSEMILVPKKNLQEKWEKEIRLFTRNNYRHFDNIVRSVVNEPVANPRSFQNLHRPDDAGANCFIFRNSSFSLGSPGDGEDRDSESRWTGRLREKLIDPELAAMFDRGERDFSGGGKDEYLKKLFAYLLNLSLPDLDLLIVDEAHNFKHGLSRDSSTRNKLLPRFLGTIWPGCDSRLRDAKVFGDDDERIFRDFPELRDRVRPKAARALLLSATPMNRGLHEIRNQLDLFLAAHPFRGLTDEKCGEAIREALPEFMIRGIMDVTVGGERLSRNMYRHEHRNGNVEKSESGPPLRVANDRDSIVLGLVQHKIISDLQRNGGAYETGLLGAFESYAVDAGNEAEIDTVALRGKNAMLDRLILSDLNKSYQKAVGGDLPHPKQDSLVDVLFDLMAKGEKALVFVRRIGSVRELERKVSRRYLAHLMEKVKSIPKPPPMVRGLVASYADMEVNEAAERVVEAVCDRILYPRDGETAQRREALAQLLKEKHGIELDDAFAETLNRDLLGIYAGEKSGDAISLFTERCEYHARQGRFLRLERELLRGAADALMRYYAETDIERDEEADEEADDFLNRQFARLKYRRRLGRQNWLHPNMYLLHRAFSIFDVNYAALRDGVPNMEDKAASVKANAMERILESAILKEEPTIHGDPGDVHADYRTSTFMTELLAGICRKEMEEWFAREPIKSLVAGMRAGPNRPEETALYEHIRNLCWMLRATFAHGSGLLPVFIADWQADESGGDFGACLRALLESSFSSVLEEARAIIRDYRTLLEKNFRSPDAISRTLAMQTPVVGVSGQHNLNVSRVAAQFRMPGYPHVVVATDILKEGEDLHTYCDNIFHYGIAWNPSDMEQRTGRIDRIGSLCERRLANAVLDGDGNVPFGDRLQVFFPYLADTLEVNQMRKLFCDLDNFVEVFYREAGKAPDRTDARVAVDEACPPLPPQKRDRLQSRYDYDAFAGCVHADVPAFAEQIVGTTREAIEAALEELKTWVEKRPHLLPPRVERHVPRLVGTFSVNGGRRAQYAVGVYPAPGGLGRFAFRLGAVVCDYNAPGVRKVRDRLEKEYGYSFARVQNSLIAERCVSSLDPGEAGALLFELAERADKAELDIVRADSGGEGE